MFEYAILKGENVLNTEEIKLFNSLKKFLENSLIDLEKIDEEIKEMIDNNQINFCSFILVNFW